MLNGLVKMFQKKMSLFHRMTTVENINRTFRQYSTNYWQSVGNTTVWLSTRDTVPSPREVVWRRWVQTSAYCRWSIRFHPRFQRQLKRKHRLNGEIKVLWDIFCSSFDSNLYCNVVSRISILNVRLKKEIV